MWATHIHEHHKNNMWMRMSFNNLNSLASSKFVMIYSFLYFIFSSAQFAFNPKDVPVRRNNASPSISSKLTESEIKQQINRLSQVYENKVWSNYNLHVNYGRLFDCFSYHHFIHTQLLQILQFLSYDGVIMFSIDLMLYYLISWDEFSIKRWQWCQSSKIGDLNKPPLLLHIIFFVFDNFTLIL